MSFYLKYVSMSSSDVIADLIRNHIPELADLAYYDQYSFFWVYFLEVVNKQPTDNIST